jgi:hypothetical protein
VAQIYAPERGGIGRRVDPSDFPPSNQLVTGQQSIWHGT